MAKSKTEVNFMEHLKPLLPAGGDPDFPRRTVTSWPLSRSRLIA